MLLLYPRSRSIVALLLLLSPTPTLHNRTASLLQLAQEKWNETLVVIVLLLLLLLLVMLLLLLLVVLLLVWRPVLATMLLSVMRLVSLVFVAATISAILRRDRVPALEIDVYPSGVILCAVLEAQLAAELLHLGLELLDVVGRVVALADDSVQVRLASSLIRADALFENALRLFDELAVQVDAIGVDTAGGVVLAEDVFGCLLVVFIDLGAVSLALVG
jgi:hypothetical protein